MAMQIKLVVVVVKFPLPRIRSAFVIVKDEHWSNTDHWTNTLTNIDSVYRCLTNRCLSYANNSLCRQVGCYIDIFLTKESFFKTRTPLNFINLRIWKKSGNAHHEKFVIEEQYKDCEGKLYILLREVYIAFL